MEILKRNNNAFIGRVILLICFTCCQSSSSTAGNNGGENYERILVQKLLKDYDTAVRPSRNISVPLNVTFGLALTQIIDVDERNQILTTNCWLNQQWIDHGLKWDPAEYGGIKQIRIPAEKVWKPDIILYNNADSQYNLAILSTNVIVNSEGNLTWLSTAIFKSSCQINVEYFPFDEQNCTMKFASWTYDGFQLNLVIQTEEGDLSNYVTNGEWSLIAMRVKRTVVIYSCCDEPYPDITYMIILRRRPLFYVFNLILPCVLISGLALLSFYMPSDSGEKVTLGITTLLSMTVFLMVIGESMPPTSEKLPLIGLYYGVTISLVSFATGLSVVTLNIHHRGMRGRELPPCLRRFIFDYLAKFLLLKLEMPKRAYLFTTGAERTRDKHLGSADCNSSVTKASLLGRRLPVGDTWRIVYPDMPATPPNSYCHCDAHQSLLNSTSWRDKARANHKCDARPTPEGGNLEPLSLEVSKSSASATDKKNPFVDEHDDDDNDDERFRPVVRVRGVPSSDLTIPLSTLSGSAATGNSFHHLHSSSHHHRSIHHHHSSFAMDDTFIDFKATHHHHRSAFDLADDLLHGRTDDVIGARLSGNGGGGRSGLGNPAAESTANSDMPQWQRQLLFLLYRINDTLEKNEDRLDDQERKDILKLEWQQAALVIDRLLLWIFVVATVAATFGILYMSPHTKLFTT